MITRYKDTAFYVSHKLEKQLVSDNIWPTVYSLMLLLFSFLVIYCICILLLEHT